MSSRSCCPHRERLRAGGPRRGRRQLQHDAPDRHGRAEVHLDPLWKRVVGALPVGARVSVDRVARAVRLRVAAFRGRLAEGQVAAGRAGRAWFLLHRRRRVAVHVHVLDRGGRRVHSALQRGALMAATASTFVFGAMVSAENGLVGLPGQSAHIDRAGGVPAGEPRAGAVPHRDAGQLPVAPGVGRGRPAGRRATHDLQQLIGLQNRSWRRCRRGSSPAMRRGG